MAKLVMMQGLPASGKSTVAKELISQGDWIRVNRDLLREMLHYGKWSGKNERMVVNIEMATARFALSSKTSVVVDDCNLNPKNELMWKQLAAEMGAKFERREVREDVFTCVERDKLREKSVGRDVIVNMAMQYGLYGAPRKGFVLCDLDGTLCDIEHRLKYASGPEKDWGKFFAGIPDDELREDTASIVMGYEGKGHEIIFVSARPEDHREATEAWIERKFKGYRPHTTLIMRKAGDSRDDTIVKQEIYDTYFKGKYPVEVVIDDRPKVIRMWRENGLTVIDMGDGIEF